MMWSCWGTACFDKVCLLAIYHAFVWQKLIILTKIWRKSVRSRTRGFVKKIFTLWSSSLKLCEWLSSSHHEFPFSCWLIFRQHIFSFIWQVVYWSICTWTWSESPRVNESFWSWWIKYFGFRVWMITKVISPTFIQCILIYILTRTWDNFYSSLRKNLKYKSFILSELTLGLSDHLGL